MVLRLWLLGVCKGDLGARARMTRHFKDKGRAPVVLNCMFLFSGLVLL